MPTLNPMKSKAFLIAALSVAAAASASVAQAREVALGGATALMRPSAPNPGWVDSDPIEVPGRVCGVSQVRVQVSGRDVRLNTVTLVFGNGTREVLNFGQARYNAPSSTTWIPLGPAGVERCVDRLVVSGYTAPQNNPPGQGMVQVIGLVQDFVPPPPPPPQPVYTIRWTLNPSDVKLVANPQVSSITNQYYTVNFPAYGQGERAGALQLVSRYDDVAVDELRISLRDNRGMIREEVLNLGGYGSNTECYAGSGCRTVIRDQALYLAKDQYTSILDLFGEQEMQILSITVKAKEQGALEAYQAGIKPVIEVYSIGKRAERVCVANCL